MCQVQRLDDYETFAFEHFNLQRHTCCIHCMNDSHEICVSYTKQIIMYVESLHTYIHS